jgi:septum site-determining protein MinC
VTLKNEEAFKLKANFLPITIIKFIRLDQQSIVNQLLEAESKAPNFFCQTPIIVDLTHAKRNSQNLNLQELTELLREHKLIPVGIQGLLATEENDAKNLGLPLWRSNVSASTSKNEEFTAEEEQPPIESENALTSPMMINKPVRSGMRIYAKQSHLILLAPVHSGAECIADGNIFCYAPVHGRLLAGASGNLKAQIFCQSLEAELIAIAGYYVLYDECPQDRNGQFQISLKEQKLHFNQIFFERSVTCLK